MIEANVESPRNLERYFHDITPFQPLSSKEEQELAKLVQAGDESAMAKLILANLRFAVSIAKQFQGRGLPLEDLIQAGNRGLIIATRKFKAKKKKFTSYANYWIRQSIRLEIMYHSRAIRRPVHHYDLMRRILKTSDRLQKEKGVEPNLHEIALELGMEIKSIRDALARSREVLSLDNFSLSDPDTLDREDLATPLPEVDSLRKIHREKVDKFLKNLGKRHKREEMVIRLCFGIGVERSMSLDEVGKRIGISRERVRQLKNRGLRRLAWNRRKLHALLLDIASGE